MPCSSFSMPSPGRRGPVHIELLSHGVATPYTCALVDSVLRNGSRSLSHHMQIGPPDPSALTSGGGLPHWCERETAVHTAPQQEDIGSTPPAKQTAPQMCAITIMCRYHWEHFKIKHTAGLHPLQAASCFANQAHVAGGYCRGLQSAGRSQHCTISDIKLCAAEIGVRACRAAVPEMR